MVENQGANTQNAKRRSLSDLLFWLALLPVILGSLICFGQLALLVNVRGLPGNTASLLKVEYMPWPYDLIPAIDLPALIEDVARDDRASGLVVTPAPVITGTYWVFPTATAETVLEETDTPIIVPPTATDIPAKPPTQAPSATRQPTSSATPRPSATVAPTLTATRTATFLPPAFTVTSTRENPRPPTATKTPTPTLTPTPTPTRTKIRPSNTPVPTSTHTRTLTPTIKVVVPTAEFTATSEPEDPPYAPVIPIAENEGESVIVEGGCQAAFGYRNENPQEVDIPVGPSNGFNIDANSLILDPPAQITHFLVGRQNGSFTVIWNIPGPFIWFLDGHSSGSAVANWCNPPEQQ